MQTIDIVLTWVDGNDPAWKLERKKYARDQEGNADSRFRDWDNLQYIFRGIDKFMPWVHKIYFVTWGHLPDWLNREHEKLVVVNHEDFIPPEYLPTFNSNTIDLNVFRIQGLSEQYILFNDDTFVIRTTKAEDFFADGIPCDMASLSPQPIQKDSITNIELNNLQILSKYFTTKDVKRNWKKWIKPIKYGSFAIRTFIFWNFSTVIGLFVPHIPISHKKSVVQKLWDMEYEEYDQTCRHKFRSKDDINDWLSRSWQILSGEFHPRTKKFGKLLRVTEIDRIEKAVANSKYKIICINDNLQNHNEFSILKSQINQILDKCLPESSSFELTLNYNQKDKVDN